MAFHTPNVPAPAGPRIRAEFNGRPIADNHDVLLFRESPFKLAHYFPEADVDRDLIEEGSAKQAFRRNGKLTTWTVRDGAKRAPYTRIDVRRSSRHIEVLLEGKRIVDSKRPFILTETGLPLRYYIPSNDVDWNYFIESDTQSIRPYKGRARYWSAVVDGNEHPDVIWAYPDPLQDALLVRDTVGFYHERLDVMIDGERQESWPYYFSK